MASGGLYSSIFKFKVWNMLIFCFFYFKLVIFRFTVDVILDGSALCSGFVSKSLSWGSLAFFSTGTYAGIGTKCVESEIFYEKYEKKK